MAKITKGNVFEDLGIDPAESADLALRAYLMSEIRKFIERNSLTQVKAAKFFGIKQPKISNIINGRIEGPFFFLLLKQGIRFYKIIEAPGPEWDLCIQHLLFFN